ncbi:MAG: AsnC family transcriptional regulator [Planctomycetota bacterium]|nr:AsnC family transcriptional regulator [Planctomycetota bacterium]
MPELDSASRLLLNAIQAGVPLVERPFTALGAQAGLSEDETLARVRKLKDDGILRQVSAIFDTRSLGYHSSLVACKVAPERVETAAAALNQHPGISHNYSRNHVYNLWFTLAVPPASSLEAHIAVLQKESGAAAMRLLPALRVFKIGVKLDMAEGESDVHRRDAETRREERVQGSGFRVRKPATGDAETGTPLTERDIRCVRALQKDMPVQAEPYAPLASEAGITMAELLAWCEEAMRKGWLRRVAGVLHHRRAGFSANGMGAWNVAPTRVEEVGRLFAAQTRVTHCYLRPRYPDWPYNVFTMVHGRTAAACDEFLAGLSRETGIRDYATLYSRKEYKKTRLLYFTGEIEAWERAHGIERQGR